VEVVTQQPILCRECSRRFHSRNVLILQSSLKEFPNSWGRSSQIGKKTCTGGTICCRDSKQVIAPSPPTAIAVAAAAAAAAAAAVAAQRHWWGARLGERLACGTGGPHAPTRLAW
jgi:hypothetical protein